MRLQKKQVFTIVLLLICVNVFAKKKLNLKSPDGRVSLQITVDNKIRYTLSCDNSILLDTCSLALSLRDEILGSNSTILKTEKTYVDEVIKPYIALKYSSVINRYNSLVITFKRNFAVEFRLYDDGFAYHFITHKKGQIEILNEDITLNFPSAYLLHLQQANSFKTAYQEPYSHVTSTAWRPSDKISTLPILIDTKSGYKMLFSESAVVDYPGSFIKGIGKNGVKAVAPKMPLTFEPDGDRSVKILKEANYIAKTEGNRELPWRYLAITRDDKQLIENTMTLKLAPKSQLLSPAWIKPGQASWEWWNGASPYGQDVNFVSGYNQDTYKYYIDFASKFGIKYIVMDEGWAKSTSDPYTTNPNINLPELIQYGKNKNVGIILWLTWLTVDQHMELFKVFQEWGIRGVKIDFMDRSDQWMVNYYERVAKEAAKHELFVDFHGAFKPSGLEYKYPNILSYEAVKGMEEMSGCTPNNSIYYPFIRNAVGPMDYTPGAMLSMQPESYISARPNSASIGTRVYQMALFIVFESALQMLADNPTLYYRNQDCTEFITSVPTTWDETKALCATVGKLAIVAKRKGEKWFIGGITNNDQPQNVTINLDFLPKNKSFKMTFFEDGVNSDRQAMDYRKKFNTVSSEDTLTFKLARNGGFAARVE
ncbi:glycoside hydrolase family 97 protein [Mucilaginibacter ginkgonis]|uniref:Glycoside hydrolase family 97 protein n=1 Tax=Mucilaginibacter ginkgonis TaxID=2682091 RepID=A0A6I4HWP5_9SPHI|nr:glycoside hydrolase family 97 protein [Mucilaginibacter ginkgonis]QQL49977.1 glycoside hydrolase family 97 protein [Mucilaginibacter ginkgonis]